MCSKQKKMAPFSVEEDDQLVEYVAEHPAIYDSGLKDYKDQQIKENIWKEISEKIKRTVADCKKRWRNIRDTYMRQRKERTGTTGKAAKAKSKWPLLEQLEFLNAVSYERTNKISVELNESQLGDEDESENPPTVRDNQENKDLPSDEDNNSSTQISRQNSEEVQSVITEKRKSAEPYSSSGAGKRRKDNNTKLLQLFQKRSEDRDKLIQNLYAKKSDNSRSDDALSVFFKSMAMTVNTFSPELIVEAKSRIWQVVSELELRSLRDKQQLVQPQRTWEQQPDSRPQTSHSDAPTDAGSYYSNFSSPCEVDDEYFVL